DTDDTDATVTIDLTRDDGERGDDLDAVRVLCAAAWSGAARGEGAPVVRADGDAARAAVQRWGLD
ncbi:MAG: hypothetical protein INR67_00680, partial [Jatrophihabitans endophyticus]|nr:hypothetical protein [Jatrophihabitans endophyticus]